MLSGIKKEPGGSSLRCRFSVTVGVVLAIAVVAIDRPIAPGLERHLGGGAALVTDYGVHLALAAALGTAVGTAAGAAAGFVLEALFGVERLLGSGKSEFSAALTAGQGFVGVHDIMSLLKYCPNRCDECFLGHASVT
jgi:hypothetical protein